VVFGFVDAPRVMAGLQDRDAAKARYSFEVATVKPGDEGSRQRMLMIGPSSVTAKNMPLKEMIMFAYDAKSTSQISGLPDWVNSTTYSIEAKEDEATAKALTAMGRDERNAQIRLMLQALFEERFHLKVSHATKELPVYALVVAKGGPKLKASTEPAPLFTGGPGGPAPVPEPKGAGPGSGAAPGPPPPLPAPGGGPGKPMMRGNLLFGPGSFQGRDASLDDFASGILSRLPETADRVVVNKTGLTGKYDFDLKWTPENAPSPGTPGADNGTPQDTNAPGLFTALEEQLGLKLESQKGAVETLVVEAIDRPTPN
jgi:uncharacterized protein (TIGR03435 family)